jgi:hypothetical protein
MPSAVEESPGSPYTFACVNARVYILLIRVSGICILRGLGCWACSLKLWTQKEFSNFNVAVPSYSKLLAKRKETPSWVSRQQ